MKQRDIITLLIPSFVLILAWVIFSIYHSSIASTITPTVSTQMSPIKPVFDINTISELKKREKVIPNYESSVAATLMPTPEFSNVPYSSLSASQTNDFNNTPQSSIGGTLSP